MSDTKHTSNALMGSLAFFLAALCAAEPAIGGEPVRDGGRSLLALAAPPSPSGPDEPAQRSAPSKESKRPAAAEGWTIVLATTGADASAARSALHRVRAIPGLEEARIETRGKGTLIVLGNYPAPGDANAQRDLARVRATQIEGVAVFAGAFLAPPATDIGQLPRFNLTNAREEFGRSARYTLQVAVYESPDRDEARRAAEKAAAQLRREGEPAFYYHGPSRSMVTVGAFTEGEARPFVDRVPGQTAGAGSAELWEYFRRHPQNLLNGNRPLIERPVGAPKDKPGVPQSSFLVEIP